MSTSAVKHRYGVSLFASPRDHQPPPHHCTTSFPSSNGRSTGIAPKIPGPASSQAPLPSMQTATEGESPGVDPTAADRSRTGSSRAGPPQTPTLKRTHSELSVTEGTQPSSAPPSDNFRSQEPRKLTRLSDPSSAAARDEGSTDAQPPMQHSHGEAPYNNDSRESGRPSSSGSKEAQDRHYTWQSTGTGGTSSGAMSITALSSPTGRSNVPLDDRGTETAQRAQREHAHYYQSSAPPPLLPSPSHGGRSSRPPMMESRLPGIASLSQRVTSPPPQVTRVNAPRSFVSATPGTPGAGTGLGRNLAHFQPGSAPGPLPLAPTASYPTSPRLGLSQHSTSPQYGHHGHHGHHAPPHLPHHSHSHSMSLPHGPSTSPILAPHAAQSCPPIHPALMGLPGSGTGPGNKQQPSFVAKLYSMLEDENTGNMITWGPSGDVFSVANPAEFSRIILPTWFKHANWQSFVRQLNMYGFHKVNHTFSGAPNEEVQIWEFKHPSFRRGEVHLLVDIKRKSSRHKRTGSQSQSFSGSIHGADFDGRGRSRSSTPIEMYGSEIMVPPMHPHSMHMHPHPFGGPNDPRLRQMPIEGDFREALPAHHRVRSLTDAAMRPPRGFTQAMREGGSELMGPIPGGSPSSSRPNPHVSHIKSSSLSTAPGGPAMAAVPSAGPSAYPTAVATSTGAGVPLPDTQESKALSSQALSDRIDAIIRHSNYLESQFRNLAEDFYHTQQREGVAKMHLLRVVGRLTNVLSIAPEEEASPGASEQMRRQMLDVCHGEISQLSGYLGLEPGSLSPPIQPRGLPPHQGSSSGSTSAALPLRPGPLPPSTHPAAPVRAPSYSARPPQGPLSPTSQQRGEGAGGATAATAPHSATGSPTEESPQERPAATSYSFPRR